MDEIIRLKEYAACLSNLTDGEARELSDHGAEVQYQGKAFFKSDPSIDKEYHLFQVNTLSTVGHYRLTSSDQRIVFVEPKVGIRNIFALLGVSYRFYSAQPPFHPPTVDYEEQLDTAIEPLVQEFSKVVRKLLQGGLLREYIQYEENLGVLRGRLVFSQQLRENLIHQDRLYCRFAQSETDVAENQVILWTLLMLQRIGGWTKELRQALQSHILHFGGVSVRQFLPKQFPVFHYHRLSSHYQEAHFWCRLFIDLMSLSDKPGDAIFNGYQLDMNVLFERFIVAMFERAAEQVPSVKPKYHECRELDLSCRIWIEPDLILSTSDERTIVLDAKYKRTQGIYRAKHPDLYQMISYCTAMGLVGPHENRVQGILVYPLSERTDELEGELDIITQRGPESELKIQVLWIDLDSENVIAETEQRFVRILHNLCSTA